MSLQTLPRNHKIFKIDDASAIIALESGPFPDPRTVPRIHIYVRSPFQRPYTSDGQVFGHNQARSFVLIIKVTPWSVIQVVEWLPEKGHVGEVVYQVGANFELLPVPVDGFHFTQRQAQGLLHSSVVPEAEDLRITESDTRLLFSNDQPPWLQEIIHSQLTHWRIHNVGLYFQHTFWNLNQEDLWHCVKAAPYWALARWQNRLKPYQIDLCVRTSPRGAISFATERLSRYHRQLYLEEFPVDALTHAAEKLTEDELVSCANKEPSAALSYPCRRHLPTHLRATLMANLLATCYRERRSIRLTGPIDELERDLIDSIVDYPDEWLSTHNGSFIEVMDALATQLAVRPDGQALLEMGNRLHESYQGGFSNFLGSLV